MKRKIMSRSILIATKSSIMQNFISGERQPRFRAELSFFSLINLKLERINMFFHSAAKTSIMSTTS